MDEVGFRGRTLKAWATAYQLACLSTRRDRRSTVVQIPARTVPGRSLERAHINLPHSEHTRISPANYTLLHLDAVVVLTNDQHRARAVD